MAAGALRNKVHHKFKPCGFTLKVDALEEALSFISPFGDGADEALDLLIDEIHRESVNSSILGRDIILQAVSCMQTAADAVDQLGRAALSIVDAFLVPRFRYDSIRRVFYQHTGGCQYTVRRATKLTYTGIGSNCCSRGCTGIHIFPGQICSMQK